MDSGAHKLDVVGHQLRHAGLDEIRPLLVV